MRPVDLGGRYCRCPSMGNVGYLKLTTDGMRLQQLHSTMTENRQQSPARTCLGVAAINRLQ
jgi:hypothetical protein